MVTGTGLNLPCRENFPEFKTWNFEPEFQTRPYLFDEIV